MSNPMKSTVISGGIDPGANARGGSLVEVMVGVVLLAVTLLSLGGAAALGLRQTSRGRAEMHQWAAVQAVVDSLVAAGADSAGWANAAGGAGSVNAYPVTWAISGSNPKRVDLVIQRPSSTGLTVSDTLVFYLARPW